jgi:hypothetical protein
MSCVVRALAGGAIAFLLANRSCRGLHVVRQRLGPLLSAKRYLVAVTFTIETSLHFSPAHFWGGVRAASTPFPVARIRPRDRRFLSTFSHLCWLSRVSRSHISCSTDGLSNTKPGATRDHYRQRLVSGFERAPFWFRKWRRFHVIER